MRWIIIVLMLFLVGCTEVEETATEEKVVGYFVASIEEQDIDTFKTFTIRAVDNGFSPEVVEVDLDDNVQLCFTNMIDNDVRSGRDTDNAVRIGITGYNVEGFYHTGKTTCLEFIASEKGVFDFGDESKSNRKGRLIVN